MLQASLVVHDFSYDYVQNFVHYVHDAMKRHLACDARLLICRTIDEASYREGLVFIIGENFPMFERRPGCVYVLLNLSVVVALGHPFSASLRGHAQVRRKRRMLSRKLPLIDVLLDYYPPQTAQLAKQLDVPVYGFDVAVAPAQSDLDIATEFDLCFVGGLTERRKGVLDEIDRRGISRTPIKGAPIEELAARSALCLNIHTERSNHLEIPRLVAALSSGCPVVTETSFGITEFGAGDLITEAPLAGIADAVEALLSDRAKLDDLRRRSFDWYRETYLSRAEASWIEVFARLVDFDRSGAAQVPRMRA